MLFTLATQEKLITRLVDFTNAFAQATLREDVYVDLPRMFESASNIDTVLKLNKSLYGLVQAPLCWYTCLKQGLLESGFTPSASIKLKIDRRVGAGLLESEFD